MCVQEPPEEVIEEVIPAGGDPDAGMPAEEAEIHGIERHPAPQQQESNTSKQSEDSEDVPTEQQPSNEQETPPVVTSSSVTHGGSLTDSVDRIHDDGVVGNSKTSSLPDSVPDPA